MPEELQYNFTSCIWLGGRSMFRKKKLTGSYDRENQIPVIRGSICTGGKVAGFKDIHTGKFTEVMVVRGDKDMQEFLGRYGILAEEIRKEW